MKTFLFFFFFYVFSALNSLQKFAGQTMHSLTMFVGKCLEIWSKHLEYHLNVQSSVCVCMRAHVCMCVRESVLVYVRRLIQKFVDTLNKHSNWIDLWMILYIHIVTSLMNVQIKIYESILNGMRVTLGCAAHATTSLLRQIYVRLNMRGLGMIPQF